MSVKQTLSKRLSSERGAGGTLIFFIISLPFIWIMFTLVVDFQYASQARDMIEDNVQTAVQSSVSALDTNKATINLAKGKALAIDQYSRNRAVDINQVKCATTSDLKTGETLQGTTSCKWILKEYKRAADRKSVTMTVREIVAAPMTGGAFNKGGFNVIAKASGEIRYSR